jgi:hypothetical protein
MFFRFPETVDAGTEAGDADFRMMRGKDRSAREENRNGRNGISTSVRLSPRELLDDFGYKMSRHPGFAIVDGLDRFGEERVAVFRFKVS